MDDRRRYPHLRLQPKPAPAPRPRGEWDVYRDLRRLGRPLPEAVFPTTDPRKMLKRESLGVERSLAAVVDSVIVDRPTRAPSPWHSVGWFILVVLAVVGLTALLGLVGKLVTR